MRTYFIAATGLPFFKVGRSVSPTRRLVTVQVGCPVKCVIVALLEGDEERRLHAALEPHSANGEWFWVSGGSRRALERLGYRRIAKAIAEVSSTLLPEEPRRRSRANLCWKCRDDADDTNPVESYIEAALDQEALEHLARVMPEQYGYHLAKKESAHA